MRRSGRLMIRSSVSRRRMRGTRTSSAGFQPVAVRGDSSFATAPAGLERPRGVAADHGDDGAGAARHAAHVVRVPSADEVSDSITRARRSLTEVVVRAEADQHAADHDRAKQLILLLTYVVRVSVSRRRRVADAAVKEDGGEMIEKDWPRRPDRAAFGSGVDGQVAERLGAADRGSCSARSRGAGCRRCASSPPRRTASPSCRSRTCPGCTTTAGAGRRRARRPARSRRRGR